jgi:hypothetical protein
MISATHHRNDADVEVCRQRITSIFAVTRQRGGQNYGAELGEPDRGIGSAFGWQLSHLWVLEQQSG